MSPAVYWQTLLIPMLANISVPEQREELKRQLRAAEYSTLLDDIVRRVGIMIQKVSRGRNPEAFWYIALLIILVITFIGLSVSIFLDEFSSHAVLVTVIAMGLIYLGMILYKVHHDDLIACIHEHVVDAIETKENLADLEHWLNLTANKRLAVLMDMIVVIGGAWLLRFYYFAATGESLGLGSTIALTLGLILYGLMVYYGMVFSTFPHRLSQYQFKLYSVDPSSSDLIYHLSRLLMSALYLLTFYVAVATLLTAAGGLFVSMNRYRLIGWWIFTTAFFLFVQYNLSKIITTAKYRTLGEIQRKIDKLLADTNPNDKESRESITWLMDYHDRVRSTRNFALDLRAVLEFLNSLLLPLLASVLANIDTIMDLFLNP